MAVLIDNRQDSVRISPKATRQTAQAILDVLEYPESELSVLVVNDSQIATLNSRFLHRKGPTNVIAFPMREGSFPDITPALLGDVVISAETAEKEARSAGITIDQRFKQLLVHGILHLLGYDHEKDDVGAREMANKSEALMQEISDLSCED